ncbi:MAG: nickel pincer cofactor biosynthesis protein LarC [Snowella sp.]|nr:nickel pincer cofactor biosynthesis protein LarC [Snowella sp.]
MTKIAYFDCPTGISGDMCLGALVDAGVPLEYLIEQLKKLGLEKEYQLWSEKVQRQGQAATKVNVDLFALETDHHHHHHAPARHLPEIVQLIQAAELPNRVRDWSLQIFKTLAIAEGAVHGIAPEAVHFHEVGATDAIVDIVGTCLGLDYLGIEKIYASALPTGGGTVWAAHGRLPVPVPAVVKLWESRQVPVYSNDIEKELVTPTGAAILVTLAESFGSPPQLQLQKMGLGAGNQDLPIANILRLWLGETVESQPQIASFAKSEEIAVLETQLDDLNPQAIGYVLNKLLQAGAVDVFTQAIGMKKSRPGILLTVICHPDAIATCQEIIFRETTTLGIRYSLQNRAILKREMQIVKTPYGPVNIKVAYGENNGNQTVLNVQSEYEDCVKLAQQTGEPWQVIHQSAIAAWYNSQSQHLTS